MNTPNREIQEDAGTWYVQIGRLKRNYTSLTNADLNYVPSQEQEMINALMAKLGVSEKVIRSVMTKTKPA